MKGAQVVQLDSNYLCIQWIQLLEFMYMCLKSKYVYNASNNVYTYTNVVVYYS